jgi:hypothetical protein
VAGALAQSAMTAVLAASNDASERWMMRFI